MLAISRIDGIVGHLEALVRRCGEPELQSFERFLRQHEVDDDELYRARVKYLAQTMYAVKANQLPMDWYKAVVDRLDYDENELEAAVQYLNQVAAQPADPPPAQPTPRTVPKTLPKAAPRNPLENHQQQKQDQTLGSDLHQLGEKVARVLTRWKRPMTYIPDQSIKGIRINKLVFEPDEDANLVKLSEQMDNLIGHAGVPRTSAILVAPARVELHVPRPKFGLYDFQAYCPKKPLIEPVGKDDPIVSPEFLIGLSQEGEQLTQTEITSVLVSGLRGSGKSIWIKKNLLAWMMWYTPRQLRLALIDVEGATFSPFKDSPHLLKRGRLCLKTEDYFDFFEELTSERDRRRDLFNRHGIEDLDHWNQVMPVDRRLPCVGVVIEEANQTFDKGDAYLKMLRQNASEETDIDPYPSWKTACDPVIALQEAWRKEGFFSVVGSQRPDAKIIDPRIRANFDERIVFKVGTEGDSRIAFGYSESCGKLLGGKGDGFWVNNGDPIRFQGLYLGADKGRGLIKDIIEYQNELHQDAFDDHNRIFAA